LILIDIVHDDEEEITVEYDILVDWIWHQLFYELYLYY
jgi:hypothetical protein